MKKFTEDEIKETIRTARLFAPHLTPEQYQRFVEMQREIADSGFIEAAWAVHHLEQKRGISCSQALDEYIQLLEDKAKIELQIAQLQDQRVAEKNKLAVAMEATRRTKEAQSQLETELKAFRQAAEDEKNQLKEELERARQDAGVRQKEIAIAGELKSQVESHDLNIQLTLKLLKEFAQDKEAAKHLAEAITEYGSQLEARETLRRENETLKAQMDQRQEEMVTLESVSQQHQEMLTQLKSDLAEEDALRRFYRRFGQWSRLLEYLAKWSQVLPLRCNWFFCGARFLVDRKPTNFRAKFVCPCCGSSEQVYYDDEAFVDLGMMEKAPLKIELKE